MRPAGGPAACGCTGVFSCLGRHDKALDNVHRRSCLNEAVEAEAGGVE
jgi:hypothetical protein